VLAGIALVCTTAFAGRLEPDDSPRGTMRTLDEVEPCTPVGSADVPITLDESGVYCLTEDIGGVSSTAITIEASDVTVDLGGFTLSGSGDLTAGIIAESGADRPEVRNGRVSGFAYGIETTSVTGTRVVDVRVSGASGYGISLGEASEILRCESGNNGTVGISTLAGSVVRDSVSRNNGSSGLTVDGIGLVEGFLAHENGYSGIWVGSGSTVRNSIASGNSVDGIHFGGLGPDFLVSDGGIVEGCSAFENGDDGIEVGAGALVRNNQAEANGSAGIHATSARNRIDGNHVTSNDLGFVTDTGGNTIVRNSARQNVTGNYSLSPGSDTGPIGTAMNATSPWANFSY
jgi:parallel beta-helix repeat protein